jgi:hypothetical protein
MPGRAVAFWTSLVAPWNDQPEHPFLSSAAMASFTQDSMTQNSIRAEFWKTPPRTMIQAIQTLAPVVWPPHRR